ncbi:putative membrane protein YccC [Streptomyces sp. Amel2xB2]|uniref:FUSC family protein n=1 Tax=Streptomyces sp. Amel2xB2 TaxID=1305829 RepID=UPI000DB9C5D7|nr:FUSC family protein [Streptomyces sp. Amel2xB2]RAJ69834.1 putative membrane protein YccC [Streptomyces sp. Amel2xB2]
MKVLPWLRAIGETARSGLSVERAALHPLLALRGALGVALVVGLTLWLGSPELAVSSAFGAFSSGVATFQRSWRPRPVLALSAAAGLAVSTFVGFLAAGQPVAFVLLLALWAFMAGMAWGLGPTAGVVAASTVAVMLVTVTLPTTLLGALAHAGLIAAGGCVQAALIVLLPVRRWGERRDALADALAAVADYARRLRHDPSAPFDPEPMMTARSAAAVTPRQARRRPRQLGGYRGLAERFRPVLASLADPDVGAPMVGQERERVRELLSAAATVLDATARAIRRGERVRIPQDALDVLQVPESGPVLHGPARKAAMRLIALTQEAVEAAQEPVEVTRRFPLIPRATFLMPARADRAEDGDVYVDTDAPEPEQPRKPRHLSRPSLVGLVPVALRTFRRELRWSSPVCRHAVRVAVAVAVTYLLGNALPPEHGYWAPLTVVMVMRPDFSRTYERGFARLGGTLVGVGIAGTVTGLLHPPPWGSAALAVASIAFMYLLMRTGYAITSVCIGAYVVFLLGVAGSLWSQTVLERIWLTALGGAVALLIYAVFPAWETPRLRDRLADWLTATGSYATAVLDRFARPREPASGPTGTPSPGHPDRRIREALLDTRAARQEWDQTASRAGAEPVRHRGRLSRLSRRSAADAQSAVITLGRATMLLEAHLPEPDAEPQPCAGEFARALERTLPGAAQAIRDSEPLDFAPVHEALSRWWEEEAERPSPSVALRSADLLADALEDLAEAVGSG